MAQYLCGLATVTSASRMAFAFARDGGLPFSRAVRWVCPRRRSPAVAIWAVAGGRRPVHALHARSTPRSPRCARSSCTSRMCCRPILGARAYGRTWTEMGPWHLGPLVPAAGVAQRRRLPGPDRHRHAAAQRAIGLGRGRHGACCWLWSGSAASATGSPGPPHISTSAGRTLGTTGQRARPMHVTRERSHAREPRRGAEPRRRPSRLCRFLDLAGAATPARILTGRAGGSTGRRPSSSSARDHAAARDAVTAELDLHGRPGQEFLAEWGLFEVATRAPDRSRNSCSGPTWVDRSTRRPGPRSGVRCPAGADIQVAIGDGLSAAAVAAQVPALLPLLARRGRRPRLAFRPAVLHPPLPRRRAQRHRRAARPGGRVLLIGERPGLATAESLSAYMAYPPRAPATTIRAAT